MEYRRIQRRIEHDIGEKAAFFVYKESFTSDFVSSLILFFTRSKHVPNHDKTH